MKLFLTGATGFIGGAIARAAISAGHQVTALVRSETSEPAAALSRVGVALHADRIEVVPLESARQTMGPFADALALDQGMSGQLAQQCLAWTAKRPGVIADLSNQMERSVH